VSLKCILCFSKPYVTELQLCPHSFMSPAGFQCKEDKLTVLHKEVDSLLWLCYAVTWSCLSNALFK